jgi:hypothetical protein
MTLGLREWRIGPHLIGFEPPDILWSKCRGPFSLEEAIRFSEVAREVGLDRPLFMLADMREAGLAVPEAARYFSEHLRFDRLLGFIYIGTRLAQRASARGILLAAQLTEQTEDADLLTKAHFVSSREEAHELIVRLRADAAAKPPCGGGAPASPR